MSYTETVVRMEEGLKGLKEDIADLRRAISGNGQAGLEERVTRLEDHYAQLLEVSVSQSGSIDKLLKTSENLCRLSEASPSLMAMIREHPFRSAMAALSTIVVFITTWFILHMISDIPGVSEWILALLHIPSFPIY